MKRRNIEAVPGRHRWARLEAPLVPPGQQRPVVHEASRIRAREWLEGRGQLLLVAGDDTGAGKTTLAAALACAAIEAGRHVVWIHASDLDPSRVGAAKADERRERLERAPFAVLDGLGKELVGAGAGVADGVATQRRGVVSAFVEGLQAREGNGQRVVITADMSRERMFAIYDDGMVRRLTVRGPHCEVIGLRRQAPIESERF